MSYAQVSDVTALNKATVLGQGKNPTEADVQVYLDLSEAEINAILVNKGYTTPINATEAPQAFQLLRRINAQGAVAQMEVARGNGPHIDRTQATYQASLKQLEDAQEIMDAALNVPRTEPRGPGITTPKLSFQPGQVFDPNVLPGREPTNNPQAPYLSREMRF